MPRKRKITDEKNDHDNGALAGNGSAAPPPTKKKRAPRKKVVAKQDAAGDVDTTPPTISDEAIRVRAYLIAQERVRRGLPGDENSDWLEARRQLMDEVG